jgi:hypothetical protein
MPLARMAFYAALLLWLNVYIARDLFFAEHTGHMNSMHGFWIALARLAGHQWWTPGWWPYWDVGMPFEFTYAPLVPAITALGSKIGGVSVNRSFHGVIGVIYILTPVTMFVMSAVLARKPGWSFIAALLYSLTSLTQLVAPDEPFAWTRVGDARRLYVTAVWDEAPHMLALTALPLVILFVVLAIQRQRSRYWVWAGAFMCIMLLANAFGMTALLITLICLLTTLGWRHAFHAGATAALAYLVCCPFLPPSLFLAISENQQFHGVVAYSVGSLTAVTLILLGCVLIWVGCNALSLDWWVRFVALFTWTMVAIPLISMYLGRTFLPQPGRYKMEAEFGLCLLAAFAVAPVIQRWPVPIRVSLALVGLSLAAEQAVNHRRFEKNITRPVKPASNIEYKVAQWTNVNLPDSRVWFPGSIAQWFNTWSNGQQMTGGSWSTAYNAVHHKIAAQSIYVSDPTDAERVQTWLKAYGVQAFAVPGKQSPEFWKPFNRPELFDGCDILWQQDDTKICRVPGASSSFAHVMSRDALVKHEPRDWHDTSELRRFTAELDTAVHGEWKWHGTDHATIRATVPAGQVVSVQVTHHPGWQATSTGKSVPLQRDGLGLMWVDPACNGDCEIQLTYKGGWELWLCRWISATALLTLGVWFYRTRRRVTVRLPQES